MKSTKNIFTKCFPSITNNTAFVYALVISFILYGNTLGHQYALDDAIVITKNQFVKQGFSGIPDLLSNDSFLGFFGKKKDLVAGGRYRPLSLVTFAMEYQLFSETPWISHLINIILYALIGWLIYLALYRLLKLRFEAKTLFQISAFSALVFMLHPIHTEVVANIKGRDELLSLFLSLLTFVCTLKYLDEKKLKWILFAGITFFAGLLAKENALAFAGIIPASIWFFRKFDKSDLTKIGISLIAPALVFLFIRSHILGSASAIPGELMNNPFVDATLAQKLATIFYTWFIYLKLLIFPHPLTYDYYPYHIQLVGFNHPLVVITLVILICLLVICLKGLKTRSTESFAILGFATSFIMVSNLIFPIGTFMNERFVFMPSLFLCFGVITFLIQWKAKTKNHYAKAIIAVLGIYVLTFYPIKTIARNKAWANDFTLFTTDVLTSANSAKSNCSAGGKLWEEGKTAANNNLKNQYFNKSEQYLRKAIKIHPQYADAWLLLGNLLFDYKKDIEGSATCYLEVLKLQSGNINAWQNIDIVVTQSTNYTWAKDYYIKLLKIDSLQFKPNYRLGVIYGRYLGNLQLSQKYLENAHRIEPKNIDGLKDLGTVYGMTNQPAKAAQIFEQALIVDQNDSQVYYNYGISLAQLGQKIKADSMFAMAQKIKSKSINENP